MWILAGCCVAAWGATGLVAVDARVPVTETGVWLEPGDRVHVRAGGAWSMWAGTWPEVSAGGYPDATYRGCPNGGLVAFIGLAETRPICLREDARFIADRAGPLFLGPNDGLVDDNGGAVHVKLATARRALEGAPPERELRGQRILVLLPLGTPAFDGARATAVLDVLYTSSANFVGFEPYMGKPVVFVADEGVGDHGAFMSAGNPIRFSPDAIDGPAPYASLVHLGDPQWSAWAWAHELGHDFTTQLGRGRFMIGPSFQEAWANVVAIQALRGVGLPEGELGHPIHDGWKTAYGATSDAESVCEDRDAYLADGTVAQLDNDPWLALCMLAELDGGRDGALLGLFLRGVAKNAGAGWPDHGAPEPERWAWFAQAFEEHTAVDVREDLRRWHLLTDGAP